MAIGWIVSKVDGGPIDPPSPPSPFLKCSFKKILFKVYRDKKP